MPDVESITIQNPNSIFDLHPYFFQREITTKYPLSNLFICNSAPHFPCHQHTKQSHLKSCPSHLEISPNQSSLSLSFHNFSKAIVTTFLWRFPRSALFPAPSPLFGSWIGGDSWKPGPRSSFLHQFLSALWFLSPFRVVTSLKIASPFSYFVSKSIPLRPMLLDELGIYFPIPSYRSSTAFTRIFPTNYLHPFFPISLIFYVLKGKRCFSISGPMPLSFGSLYRYPKPQSPINNPIHRASICIISSLLCTFSFLLCTCSSSLHLSCWNFDYIKLNINIIFFKFNFPFTN